MFALFYTFLYIHKWCQEKNTCTGKTAKIESQNTFVCERAIFVVFNSFAVKTVSFFTTNVKFILSSKSGGCLYRPPPPPPPKKVGGYIPPSPPPRIYASACMIYKIKKYGFIFHVFIYKALYNFTISHFIIDIDITLWCTSFTHYMYICFP